MTKDYYEEETFKNLIKPGIKFIDMEFAGCCFENCNFSEGDFSHAVFEQCRFINCNLSMIKLTSTSFKTVDFYNCKITGADFSHCNDFIFEVSFHHSILDYVTFIQLNMKNFQFDECQIHDANFTRANLESAAFHHCDLQGAIFERTNLIRSDLSTAYNFIIDPNNNSIKKAKFSLSGLPGLLTNFDIIVE